jgi:hypothetical protein
MEEFKKQIQGELDFGKGAAGYFEIKEGIIFSLIREKCPGGKISFRLVKGGNRRQFKIECRSGEVYLLNFTDSFLYSRSSGDLKTDLFYNLDYMKSTGCSSRALFGKGCVLLKNL